MGVGFSSHNSIVYLYLPNLHNFHTVLVFTHAPPMGSGLRVVQNVHIKNGCAWLNHSSGEEERRVFLRLCKENHCIKAWFSGHFHLSHNFQLSKMYIC